MLVSILLYDMEMQSTLTALNTRGEGHLVTLPNGHFCSGLEKLSVLLVPDQFLKLKTDLVLEKKLKNRSIKLCISQDFAIHRLTLSPVRTVHT